MSGLVDDCIHFPIDSSEMFDSEVNVSHNRLAFDHLLPP